MFSKLSGISNLILCGVSPMDIITLDCSHDLTGYKLRGRPHHFSIVEAVLDAEPCFATGAGAGNFTTRPSGGELLGKSVMACTGELSSVSTCAAPRNGWGVGFKFQDAFYPLQSTISRRSSPQ